MIFNDIIDDYQIYKINSLFRIKIIIAYLIRNSGWIQNSVIERWFNRNLYFNLLTYVFLELNKLKLLNF